MSLAALLGSRGARVGVAVAATVLTVKYVLPTLRDALLAWPRDAAVGTLPVMSRADLEKSYAGRRVLLVGGTRGVGLGAALAMAAAGAHVTVVGRSAASGASAVAAIKATAADIRG